MARLRLKEKKARVPSAPRFEDLDALDQLLVRAQASDPRPGPELESAPGYTVASWIASPQGQAWARTR